MRPIRSEARSGAISRGEDGWAKHRAREEFRGATPFARPRRRAPAANLAALREPDRAAGGNKERWRTTTTANTAASATGSTTSGTSPKVFYALIAVDVLWLAADFFYKKKAEFDAWGGWADGGLGFYPVYGFVGAFLLVLAAKQMRRVLMRPEDYYERRRDGGAS